MASLDFVRSRATFRTLPDNIDMVPPVDSAVRLKDETAAGTGVFPRAIHEANARSTNCFAGSNRAPVPSTVFESRVLSGDKDAHTAGPRRDHNFDEILGRSRELVRLLDRVTAAAPTDANVLIIGETGSGKELIARAIHSRSARKNSPLVKVNCGAIPAGLVESELFGHVKGAFTSASERRVGRFELANNGTLFLDEVGELPLETQVKLLRVLQEQEFEPVGSSRTIKVNVRIIAATNRDLEAVVKSGTFRSDLYYRLNVIPLHVPPLRERRSDIPEMATVFLQHYGKRIGKPIQSISRETMRLLVDYSWPGNIRELQNVIERGVVLSMGTVLSLGPDLLPIEESYHGPESEEPVEPQSTDSLADIQRQHILDVLERTGWVISGPNGAGAILNLHPNTLRSLMARLGIRRPSRVIPETQATAFPMGG